MQPQTGDAYSKQKHDTLQQISNVLVDKLEAGEMDEEEAKEVATYVLDTLKNTSDQAGLNELLKNLAEKWPVFKDIQQKHAVSAAQEEKKQKAASEDSRRIESLKEQLVSLSGGQ